MPSPYYPCRCRDGQGRPCEFGNNAEFAYYSEDGKRVPGVGSCRPHAEDVIREYYDKMHWNWTIRSDKTGEIIKGENAKRLPVVEPKSTALLDTLKKLGFPI